MDFSFLRAKAYINTPREENGKDTQIYQKRKHPQCRLHCLTPKGQRGFLPGWPHRLPTLALARVGVLTAPERDPVS